MDQGPVVQVQVEGAKFSKSRLHLLVPVYEEGTVDNDLLNEGTFNMKDFLQQEGYFNPQVEVKQLHPGTGGETVLFTVDKGVKNKVSAVTITGNKYFSTDLLKRKPPGAEGECVPAQRTLQHAVGGSGDQKTIEGIYRANGFSKVKVTSSVTETKTAPNGKALKVGRDQVLRSRLKRARSRTFGAVELNGVDPSRAATIKAMLQATSGQPFSLVTLSGDRDVVLSYYLSSGFDKARIEVSQTIETADKSKTDIGYNVTEGEQVFMSARCWRVGSTIRGQRW